MKILLFFILTVSLFSQEYPPFYYCETQYDSISIDKFEKIIIDSINVYRKSKNLSTLQYEKCYKYNSFIREWGKKYLVVSKNNFSYFSTDETDSLSVHYNSLYRIISFERNNNICLGDAQEIASYGYLDPKSVKNINLLVKGWINSHKHNDAILDKDWNYANIGFFFDKNTKKYCVYILFYNKLQNRI